MVVVALGNGGRGGPDGGEGRELGVEDEIRALVCPEVSMIQMACKLTATLSRVVEYEKLVNKRFVKGCPDNFNYGQSTWVKLDDIGGVVERMLRQNDTSDSSESMDAKAKALPSKAARKVVLVGHGLRNGQHTLHEIHSSTLTLNSFSRRNDIPQQHQSSSGRDTQRDRQTRHAAFTRRQAVNRPQKASHGCGSAAYRSPQCGK